MRVLEKEISQAIQKALGLKVTCRIDLEFAWYDEDNILTFPPYWYDEEIDYIWADWIKKIFNVEVDHDFCYYLSFLHELGHKITLKNITDEEYYEADRLLQDEQEKYYSSKREYVATAWAIRLLINQPEKVEVFHRMIWNALNDYYERNNIN